MPSIFGQDHRNRVAAARGKGPNWGNELLPALRERGNGYISPLMGGLRPNMGPPQQNSMTPPGPNQGPMGSIPGSQAGGPKFGSNTGPVNPGGPAAILPGQQQLPPQPGRPEPRYNGPHRQLFGALAGRFNIGR